MTFICVYLGANPSDNKNINNAVKQLGQEIANHDLSLVYGGSSLGLMGLLAYTVKEYGGKTVGVITKHLLDKEIPLTTLDELHVVDTMQERRHLMQQKSDMFLVMPGGLGTLEEAFDTWNAIKIGLFKKPIGFLNTNGYFDELFSFISNCEQEGFIAPHQSSIPKVHSDIKQLLASMLNTESF